MLQAKARCLISAASWVRFEADRVLESASASMGLSGSSITAAAYTGPAKGPRPASSIPAINGRVADGNGTDGSEELGIVQNGLSCQGSCIKGELLMQYQAFWLHPNSIGLVK